MTPGQLTYIRNKVIKPEDIAPIVTTTVNDYLTTHPPTGGGGGDTLLATTYNKDSETGVLISSQYIV
jgi:hypothetical protein